MSVPLLTITVEGDPITQGSKTRGRYGMYDDNAEKLKPWRATVSRAAHAAAWAGNVQVITGPVRVEATFTLPRPKAAKNRPWPYKRQSGDVDKLVRAVLDSLTDAAVWQDDAQVVEVPARKVYPATHPLALGSPGAVIHIWSAHTVQQIITIDPDTGDVVTVTRLSSTDDGVHEALVHAFTNPPAYTAPEVDRG